MENDKGEEGEDRGRGGGNWSRLPRSSSLPPSPPAFLRPTLWQNNGRGSTGGDSGGDGGRGAGGGAGGGEGTGRMRELAGSDEIGV